MDLKKDNIKEITLEELKEATETFRGGVVLTLDRICKILALTFEQKGHTKEQIDIALELVIRSTVSSVEALREELRAELKERLETLNRAH